MISQPKHQSFRVFVRCRPLNERQNMYAGRKRSITIIEPSIVTLTDCQGKQNSFNFDSVFNENLTNEEVFRKAVQPLIKHFANGYNSTVFAYGITGAGKSFTMFGNYYQSNSTPGLIPLTFNHLLNTLNLEGCRLRMSYIEIYNEQIYDLLKDHSDSLQIIEDPEKGVIVLDLEQRKVTDLEEVNRLIIDGNNRRVMAQTNANDFSSRSHAIVLITLERKIDDKTVIAKLSLVDLAGSEKGSVHETKGIRTLEGSNINKSLLSLGNCINALSENKKPGFVPYRDSKLTRLLKDSLGGNTKTVMIACISQSSMFHDQTLNTLKYAGRAKKIEKIVHQNFKENATHNYKQQIERLKKENELLKMVRKSTKAEDKKATIESIVINLVQTLRDGIQIQQKLKETEDLAVLTLASNNTKQKQLLINTLVAIAGECEPDPISFTHQTQKSNSPKMAGRAKSALRQKQNRLPEKSQDLRLKAKKALRYGLQNNLSNSGKLSCHPLQKQTIKMERGAPFAVSQVIYDKQTLNLLREHRMQREGGINLTAAEINVVSSNKSLKRTKHIDSLQKIQLLNDMLASKQRRLVQDAD